MDIRTAFPSRWLNHLDLQGQQQILSIRDITIEKVGEDEKPVIWFMGAQKGFGLNKTNAAMLERILGPETNAWIGQQICLYPTTTEYKGDIVDCIRVKAVEGAQPPAGLAQPPPPATPQMQPPPVDDSGDIPF
jgi:hypothetical protein